MNTTKLSTCTLPYSYSHPLNTVADSGGVRGVQMHPPLVANIMYFCVHNLTSPSNDYAGVACSNNNQA